MGVMWSGRQPLSLSGFGSGLAPFLALPTLLQKPCGRSKYFVRNASGSRVRWTGGCAIPAANISGIRSTPAACVHCVARTGKIRCARPAIAGRAMRSGITNSPLPSSGRSWPTVRPSLPPAYRNRPGVKRGDVRLESILPCASLCAPWAACSCRRTRHFAGFLRKGAGAGAFSPASRVGFPELRICRAAPIHVQQQ